ncbi:unnamed protein product, partial [Prorocentrum cordatum]
ATSISLAIDESKYRKIVRFRVDLPIAACTAASGAPDLPSARNSGAGLHVGNVGASGFCASGVLGLLDCSKKRASDFEDDHAVTAVKQLDDFLTKFCTPLGKIKGHRGAQPLACDQKLKAHVLGTVTSFAADGASKERRSVFLAARDLFPNLLIVIRDPAHAIRIACKSMHCDDVFGQVWKELFDDRHALVPDLMNSTKWHNLLVAIQEDNVHAVAVPGLPGGPQPLAGIVRNLAFAKQRFDSTAGPVLKIALMLLPVATLLAYIASDRRRDREQRERAGALLRKFDTEFCMAVGVSADWGIICNWFLRLFDVASHDIAKSRSEIDCMVETFDAVFVQGRVFQTVLQAGFITETAMRNLRTKYVFYADGDPVMPWGEPAAAHKEELLHRMQNVAGLTKERLLQDFPRTDVRSALAMFDRRLVQKGFGPVPDVEVRRFLLRGARQLAALLGCDEQAAMRQYDGVLPYMMEQMEPSQPLAGATNQQAWARVLDDDFWEAACPRRLRGSSRVLCRLVRFYISIEDGECTVERDLARFRDQRVEHRTDDIAFHDDGLIVKLNGPKTAADFDEGAARSGLGLTSFSRECASLWLELFGHRHGHYNPHATAAAKLKRRGAPGLVRGRVRAVLGAARLAVAAARLRRARGQSSTAVHSGAGTEASALWNDGMGKFQARSRKNIPGVTQARACPGAPFASPPGVHLAPRRGATTQPLARPSPCSKVASLGGATDTCPARGCATVTGRHRCAEADLVVVPDFSFLHDLDAIAASADLTVSYFYIASLGLDVVTKTHLVSAQCHPDGIPLGHRMRHVPANQRGEVIHLAPGLVAGHPDVRAAARRVARRAGSKLAVSEAPPPAAGGTCFSSLRDVVAWASAARKVRNEGGPKAVTVDGMPMRA